MLLQKQFNPRASDLEHSVRFREIPRSSARLITSQRANLGFLASLSEKSSRAMRAQTLFTVIVPLGRILNNLKFSDEPLYRPFLSASETAEQQSSHEFIPTR
jgi:hypothetical protein